MIDGKFEYGAYRPFVPDIYQQVLLQSTEDDGSNVSSSDHDLEYSTRTDFPDIISCAISRKCWKEYKLISKVPFNHDTCLFEFALDNKDQLLNLPVTAHILVRIPLPETLDKNHHENSFHEYNTNHQHSISSSSHVSHSWSVRPYTSISPFQQRGTFTLMIKRYDAWGISEKQQLQQHEELLLQYNDGKIHGTTANTRPVYYFTKTDHSYKPPGVVSTYIHNLPIGQGLEMKFALPYCLGKIPYPFPKTLSISAITMIAVGVGISPMIRILRALLDHEDMATATFPTLDKSCLLRIRLLYGVRTVDDILQRSLLDEWHHRYNKNHHLRPMSVTDNHNKDINHTDENESKFRVMYCIGSRWSNIHFGAKTHRNNKNNISKVGQPPLPKGYESISNDCKCIGWIDDEKVLAYGASTPTDLTHYIFICGLPGVYRDLVGKRSELELCPTSQLARVGFSTSQIVKF